MLLGIHLTLMIGPTIAAPAPPTLVEALSDVEVTTSDHGRSGFQLKFQVGRSGPLDLIDYPLLINPLLLKPFNRVVLMVTFNVTPRILIDGYITNVELMPSNEPGQSTLTVTGEDASLKMDMKSDQPSAWPSLGEDMVVRTILLKYANIILPTFISAPPVMRLDPPTRYVPAQVNTDLKYIKGLAERNGYVFFIKPGPVANINQAYWGPPDTGFPQKALSVNMGPESNVETINFSYNALAPRLIKGRIQDSETNVALPVITPPVRTRTPMARDQPLIFNQPNVRVTPPPVMPEGIGCSDDEFGGSGHARSVQGLDFAQAQARSMAIVNASTDEVVTANGQLNALEYGNILESRSKVCLRGAGQSYDGFYRVKSVTHSIRIGEYKQRFTLVREGTGALTPGCPP